MTGAPAMGWKEVGRSTRATAPPSNLQPSCTRLGSRCGHTYIRVHSLSQQSEQGGILELPGDRQLDSKGQRSPSGGLEQPESLWQLSVCLADGSTRNPQLPELAVLESAAHESVHEGISQQQLVVEAHGKGGQDRLAWDHSSTAGHSTVVAIEGASRKANMGLGELRVEQQKYFGNREKQLTVLQDEVSAAHKQLVNTQACMEQRLEHDYMTTLPGETAMLEATLVTAGMADSSELAAAATLGPMSLSSQAQAVSKSWRSQQQSQHAQQQQESGVRGRREGSGSMRSARRRGLQSSLELEKGLENHWFAVHFTSHLTKDKLIPFELLGEPWVLFRDADGGATCVRDECAHRACPLSLGKVVDGELECPYHGWRYQGNGDCTLMPSTLFCRGVSVSSLPCREVDGLIWVWPGKKVPTSIPTAAAVPTGYTVHAELEMEVPVEHGLLIENLLDLAHAPFTHTSTFARGWPIPDIVKFKAARMLSGRWDPYPISMTFEPPCMTISIIGLTQPGSIAAGQTAASCPNHLNQLHVALPSKAGHTRLLYRMSMDFMPWVQHIPGIKQFWRYIAGQVLGEDLVLVAGQQDRMMRGADTWANPVSYDKLAVRYRRWRNAVGGGDDAAEAGAREVLAMSSGELFSLEDEDVVCEEDLFADTQARPPRPA